MTKLVAQVLICAVDKSTPTQTSQVLLVQSVRPPASPTSNYTIALREKNNLVKRTGMLIIREMSGTGLNMSPDVIIQPLVLS